MTSEQIYKVLTELLSEEVERLNEILEEVVVRLNELEDEQIEKRHEINDLHRAVADLEAQVN